MVNPIIDGGLFYTIPLNMFSKSCGDTVKRHHSIAAHITHLLLRSLPLAVAGFVIAIVIDSSKAHAFGGFSHISEKVFEFLPPLTYSDSPAYVTMGSSAIVIGASRKHALPNPVGSGFDSSPCCSVGGACYSGNIIPVTPTRLGISSSQGVVQHGEDFSAVATAHRSSAFHGWEWDVGGISDDNKSFVTLSDERYFLGHSIVFVNVVLSGGDGDHRSRCAIMTDTA
jgi:hypothetical protein